MKRWVEGGRKEQLLQCRIGAKRDSSPKSSDFEQSSWCCFLSFGYMTIQMTESRAVALGKWARKKKELIASTIK